MTRACCAWRNLSPNLAHPSCTGSSRNGRPMPHTGSHLAVAVTIQAHALNRWGRCGVSATRGMYPSSALHGSQPICPLWTHQSRPLWCWHWIWRGGRSLQASLPSLCLSQSLEYSPSWSDCPWRLPPQTLWGSCHCCCPCIDCLLLHINISLIILIVDSHNMMHSPHHPLSLYPVVPFQCYHPSSSSLCNCLSCHCLPSK